MTELNLKLHLSENVSQGHLILMVCGAKVTPKLN